MKKTTKKTTKRTTHPTNAKPKNIIHYPNLQTVLMVEEILKRERDITRTELKKKLPKKIMHQTLNVIINYLEDSGKIIDHRQGILWTHNDNPKFLKLLEESTPWTETFQELDKKHNKDDKDSSTNARSTTHILRRSEEDARDHRRKKGARIRRTVALHQ